MKKVSISPGNKKLGAIPSVSLPACVTCNPAVYWLQVKAAASMSRFFRYHVSGDIPNAEYFAQMVKTAKQLPYINIEKKGVK